MIANATMLNVSEIEPRLTKLKKRLAQLYGSDESKWRDEYRSIKDRAKMIVADESRHRAKVAHADSKMEDMRSRARKGEISYKQATRALASRRGGRKKTRRTRRVSKRVVK